MTVSPELDFRGRFALVTGAGRGLGREYAILLAERGAQVVVNDLGCAIDGTGGSTEAARETVAAIRKAGGTAVESTEDISIREGAEKTVAIALEHWSRLDVVVNNAGVFIPQPFEDVSDEAFSRILDTHVGGTFRVTQAAWNTMRQQRYGRIVNTCSASIYGLPAASIYAAAKGAILGLTKALAVEGAASNIKVNAVMPAAYTRMVEQSIPAGEFRTIFAQLLPPDKVAAVVGLLAHEDVPCTGEILEAGGGHVRRVFLAATAGRTWGTPVLEELSAAYADIADTTELLTPVDSNEALQSITNQLAAVTADIPDLTPHPGERTKDGPAYAG